MSTNNTITNDGEFVEYLQKEKNESDLLNLTNSDELKAVFEDPTKELNLSDIMKTNTLEYMYDPLGSVYKGSVDRSLRHTGDAGMYYEIAPHAFIYFVPPDLTGINYDAFDAKHIVDFKNADIPYDEGTNEWYASLATLPMELRGINVHLREMLLQETQYINIEGLNTKQLAAQDDAYQITIPLLNNMFLPDSYNVTDPTMDGIEAGENMDGFRQVTPGNMDKSMVSNQMTIEYQEVASPKYGNAMITKLHKAWMLYMKYVRKGLISPTAKYTMGRKYKFDAKKGIVNAGGVNIDSTSYRKALNMMGSIYYFKLGPNGKDIVYWEKGTGVWPSNISMGSYSGGQKGPVKVNITYQVQFMEQMNLETIIEFNELNMRYNTKFAKSYTAGNTLPNLMINSKTAFVLNGKNSDGSINTNTMELHVGYNELIKIENTDRIVLPYLLGYDLSINSAYNTNEKTEAQKNNMGSGASRTADVRDYDHNVDDKK